MKDNNSGQQPVKTKEEILKPYKFFGTVHNEQKLIIHFNDALSAMEEYASQFSEGQQDGGFLKVLEENYEAAKRLTEEDKIRPAQDVLLETYEDLIEIYKYQNPEGQQSAYREALEIIAGYDMKTGELYFDTIIRLQKIASKALSSPVPSKEHSGHIKGMKHGLYRIYWKEEDGGGASLASVGYTHDGSNWHAPCNWTSENNNSPMVASTDWSSIEKAELILENDYENKNMESKEQGEESYGMKLAGIGTKTFDTLRIEQHKRRMELEKENEELKAEIERLKGLIHNIYWMYGNDSLNNAQVQELWEKFKSENNL